MGIQELPWGHGGQRDPEKESERERDCRPGHEAAATRKRVVKNRKVRTDRR